MAKEGASCSAPSFNSLGHIWSGPQALCTSNALNSSATSDSDTVILSKIKGGWLGKRDCKSHKFEVSSLVKTEMNNH